MTRDQLRQAADIIRETISARDYAALIGIPVNRAGFAQCPFHPGDHTGSLKLYEGRRGWTCFGCHASGDVIELAKRYYNLSFPQAIMKVAKDADIPIPGVKPTYEQAQAIKAAQKHKAELDEAQAMANEIDRQYWETYDAWLEITRDERYGQLETIISRALECGIDPKDIPDVLIDEFNRLHAARVAVIAALERLETRRIQYERG